MKICFVAAPLIARSGVYNSASELVTAGRGAGHDWSALLGVSSNAGGAPRVTEGVSEFVVEPRGMATVLDLRSRFAGDAAAIGADVVISLVPQSDMALSLTRLPWVSYLRGLPWPAAGEANPLKRVLWHALELAALRRSLDVWATTPLLVREVGGSVNRLVAPGIAPPPEPLRRGDAPRTFVWAARYSKDKDPMLFVDAMRGTSARGVMYGTGPMEEEVRANLPDNISAPGWVTSDRLWSDARAYVGTSSREAFGRSAVEAAMLGIPVLLSSSFGCAEMLYTSDSLRERMVIESRHSHAWRSAIETLDQDAFLREEAALHAQANAAALTIGASVESVIRAAEETLRRTAR